MPCADTSIALHPLRSSSPSPARRRPTSRAAAGVDAGDSTSRSPLLLLAIAGSVALPLPLLRSPCCSPGGGWLVVADSASVAGVTSTSFSSHPLLSSFTNWCTGSASKNSWAMHSRGAVRGTLSRVWCHSTFAPFHPHTPSPDSTPCSPPPALPWLVLLLLLLLLGWAAVAVWCAGAEGAGAGVHRRDAHWAARRAGDTSTRCISSAEANPLKPAVARMMSAAKVPLPGPSSTYSSRGGLPPCIQE
mmetsp:Transcript_30717/g.78518  ORF Transcript_30717/g.78518 Transcript_30717/m.78518 type:complete len:246 (+) Transcript_30717:93-830(+)